MAGTEVKVNPEKKLDERCVTAGYVEQKSQKWKEAIKYDIAIQNDIFFIVVHIYMSLFSGLWWRLAKN